MLLLRWPWMIWAKAKQRAASLHAIMERLGLGEGASVADIGVGNGRDTWVFAEIVGPQGAIYSEEIAKDKVDSLKKEAQRRELPQLHAILGRGDDPCLPTDSVDLAYMHSVYHHFAKPREMLRGLWRRIKPEGYLVVVVDRHRGTLRDWDSVVRAWIENSPPPFHVLKAELVQDQQVKARASGKFAECDVDGL